MNVTEYQRPLPLLESGAPIAAELNKPWSTRCSARLLTNSARSSLKGSPPFDRCSASAKFVVNGNAYCRVHAGVIALITLMEMQDD